MPRLMSVSLTEDAVRARLKTVTRRLGWRALKPGDRLTLVRKAQGRKRKDGTVEPLVRLAEVEVVNVHRERLDHPTTMDGRTHRARPQVDGITHVYARYVAGVSHA